MKFRFLEKLNARKKDANASEMPVIAFLGDSVTQGCFCCNDTNESYVTKFRHLLGRLYPSVPAYVLNAGIGGNNTEVALNRIDRDVLRYHPDLVVVNLGLNDIWGGENSATVYAQTLGKIFDTITAAGAEVIYMTPNTINYYRSGATEPHNMDVALITADFMTSGHFDGVIEAGRAEARKRNIPICDCTKKWKNFERAGVDTTLFLSGGINHPYPDMHWLFATTLIETLFDLNAD